MADKVDKHDDVRSESALRNVAENRLVRTHNASPELKDLASEKILHELRVHQIELEMQNDELKRVQEELEESRDKYQAIYDSAPVGLYPDT